jgi:hypothetical protein
MESKSDEKSSGFAFFNLSILLCEELSSEPLDKDEAFQENVRNVARPRVK